MRFLFSLHQRLAQVNCGRIWGLIRNQTPQVSYQIAAENSSVNEVQNVNFKQQQVKLAAVTVSNEVVEGDVMAQEREQNYQNIWSRFFSHNSFLSIL